MFILRIVYVFVLCRFVNAIDHNITKNQQRYKKGSDVALISYVSLGGVLLIIIVYKILMYYTPKHASVLPSNR